MDKGPPPPGGDQNKAAKTITIWAVLISLSVITCLAVAKFGVDVFLTRAGFGRHLYYLDATQLMRFKKLNFVSGILTNFIICLVKLSVALFLLRIGGLRRWLRYSLFATIALLVSSTIATIVIIFVQCRPIAGIWEPPETIKANCLPPSALTIVSYCSTAMSIFTDFLCAILPWQIIKDLHMNRRTKISVVFLLALGSLAMICGIIRITYIKDLHSETDPTWDNVILAIWSSAEYFVGIIAGSIPPCRALVLQTARNFRGKASSSEATSGVSKHRSGNFYSLQKLSNMTNALHWAQAPNSKTSRGSRGSRGLRKNHIPMKPWDMKANRALSQDSGSESILPLQNVSGANPDTGIWKTVDVREADDRFISKVCVRRHIAIEIIVGGSGVTDPFATLGKGVLDGDFATNGFGRNSSLSRAAQALADMKSAVLVHREIKMMLMVGRKSQERLAFSGERERAGKGEEGTEGVV
ncbi:hypothetical protein BDR22DRAFT_817709 [Usnea florida]